MADDFSRVVSYRQIGKPCITDKKMATISNKILKIA